MIKYKYETQQCISNVLVCISFFISFNHGMNDWSVEITDGFLDIVNPPELLSLQYIYLLLLLLFLGHLFYLVMFFKESWKLWLILWHEAFIFSNNFMSKMEGSIVIQCKKSMFLQIQIPEFITISSLLSVSKKA